MARDSADINADNAKYLRYTGPQRIDIAIHVLEGLLKGISIDHEIKDEEVYAIKKWLDEHKQYANKKPFDEVHSLLNDILEDGVIDEEEREDLRWFCERFTTDEGYYSYITSDLQRLHGILGGIVSDGIISKEELEGLSKWIDDNEHLKGYWPFDELEAIILEVLRDGIIDEQEHNFLKTFFADFLKTDKHKVITFPLNEIGKDIKGICAVCPEIILENSKFCFTGKFKDIPRAELKNVVKKHNGHFTNSVTQDLDYLVIGSEGNTAWVFSCYGRKVEKAIDLRKQGKKIIIAHEFDFWDAIQDASC